MSRKRKINHQEFDVINIEDAEEKTFFNGKEFNYFRPKSLVDFNVFPSCETLVSNNSGCITDKDDVVISNLDDFNVSNNDSLLINSDSCNYECIFTENDILNSVSENTNFYNESITLYSSNNENEILFDNSFEQDCYNNLESVVTNASPICTNNDVLSNDYNIKTIVASENLENIVPNLCFNPNSSSDINHNNSANENESFNRQCDNAKSDSVASVINSEPQLSMCVNNTTFSSASQQTIMLNEFLNFKESQTNSYTVHNNKFVNNGNDNHTVVENNFTNISGSGDCHRNLKIIPFHCLKDSRVLVNKFSKSIGNDFLNTIGKVSACQITNIKDCTSLKVNVKPSELSNNDIKNIICSIKNKKVPLVKFEDLMRNQETIKVAESNYDGSKITKLCAGTVDKCVQTVSKCILYSNLCDVNESEKVCKNNSSKNDKTFFDKIRKPEPFKELLLFSFGVNVRSSLCSVLTQEDFINNNEKISYYTGIPQYSYFMALLNMLQLPNNKIISPFQMLLLTLMKIRLNLDWHDLAYRFDRSVQIVRDTFGITLFVLTKCLSNLVNWPLPNTSEYLSRTGRNLYVYSVKLICDSSDYGRRVFICLSNAGYPIHFVSKPISEDCNNRLTILESSGIINGLVQNDNIIFDKNTNYVTNNEERPTVLSVLSKSRDSFCAQLYDESIDKDIEKMKKTISEVRRYKFLFENISCEWVNSPANEYQLFIDVVNVVCGLINLCDKLPFSNSTVKKIISGRKSMKLRLT